MKKFFIDHLDPIIGVSAVVAYTCLMMAVTAAILGAGQ